MNQIHYPDMFEYESLCQEPVEFADVFAKNSARRRTKSFLFFAKDIHIQKNMFFNLLNKKLMFADHDKLTGRIF